MEHEFKEEIGSPSRRRSTMMESVARQDANPPPKLVADIELRPMHEERYPMVVQSEREQGSNSTQDSSKPLSHRTIDEYFDAAYQDASGPQQKFPWRFWLIFVAMGMGNLGDAVELASMSYLLSDDGFVSEILHHDMKHNASILTSVAPAGMIIGGLLAGAFENSLGRKRVVLFGLFINAASCLASAFAPHVGFLAFFRFAAGLGIGAFYSSLVPLSTELSPPCRRGFCVTLVGSFWSAGLLYLNALAYAVLGIEQSSWRVFVGMTSVPTIIAFAFIFYLVPESTRSLALRGDFTGAANSANIMTDGLQYRGEKLSSEEVRHQFEQTGVVGEKNDNKAFWVAMNNLKMLYSPSLWKKTITVHMIWIFLEAAGSTGSWLNTIFVYDGASKFLGSLFLAIGSVMGGMLGATVMDRIGRRWTLTVSLALIALSSTLLAWAVHSDGVHIVITMACACSWSIFVSTAWSANSVITGEVFPTQVRGSAGGLAAAVGRTALIIIQFANGSLADEPVALLLFGSSMSIIGAIATKVCHPDEMSHLPLEDTIAPNDGPVNSDKRRSTTERTYKKLASDISDHSHSNTDNSVQGDCNEKRSLDLELV